MKLNLFLTISCIQFIFALSAQNDTRPMVVQGTIKCDKELWLVLEYVGEVEGIKSDSVYLKKGINNVNLKGVKPTYNGYQFYHLKFKGGRFSKRGANVLLFYYNKTIIVDIDVQQSISYAGFDAESSIKNSPATVEMYKFWKKSVSLSRKINLLKDRLDSLKIVKAKEADIENIKLKINKFKQKREKFYIKTTLNAKYPPTAAEAFFYIIDYAKDIKDYTYLADSLEKKFPNSYIIKTDIKDFRKNLERQKNTINKGNAHLFSLYNEQNKKISLTDFRGNYVLLDFWASWCTPCVKEIPHNIELQKKYADKGFKIITISIDKKRADWLTAIKKHSMQSFINLHDEGKKVAQMYNLSYVPLTILIDPKGEIIESNLRDEDLDRKLRLIFKE